MPIYEFKCNKCGKVFELLCIGSDDEKGAQCPSCGGTETTKLLSTFCSASGTGTSLEGNAAASSCSGHGGFS